VIRRIGAASFDEEALADLDSEDIDFAAASQYFAARRFAWPLTIVSK
jgi:hypothetical protein